MSRKIPVTTANIFLTLTLLSLGYSPFLRATEDSGIELNDIHSQLNPTLHAAVLAPKTVEDIQTAIRKAKQSHQAISISGGRHSMGGQQFGTGTLNLNLSSFNQVIALDANHGIVEVQSGIQWPELVDWLLKNQKDAAIKWGIRQKQTGADRLSIGGALSSNIHGRGLKMKPMIDDVESFTLIDADGEMKRCSRTENQELFQLVIGGYGLFGVIGTVKIRLAPVQTLERVVKLIEIQDFIPLVTVRTDEGYLYGDFQFAIDPKSDDFLKRGIYSLYKPVHQSLDLGGHPKELKEADWIQLLKLAHTDKSKAFEMYSKFYLESNGQLYSSDTHQMGVYIDNYHRKLEPGTGASEPEISDLDDFDSEISDLESFDPIGSDPIGTEMISEIYVPREKLPTLFSQLREDFRKHNVNVIYGTVRLIEKDTESFLPWAKRNYAAIVFNFHVEHTPEGVEKAKHDFRMIIDRALDLDGSYYLTYHRWARQDQVLKAYPQMLEFLHLKKEYDPQERFQSDWYRYYKHHLSTP